MFVCHAFLCYLLVPRGMDTPKYRLKPNMKTKSTTAALPALPKPRPGPPHDLHHPAQPRVSCRPAPAPSQDRVRDCHVLHGA
jgi:hypothetical protein